MARAHFVKKARKDNPAVKKGESYYWWAFMQGGRGGPKHYSATAPRASQLTSSEFLSQAYELNERIEDLTADDADALKSEVDDIAGEFENLGSETQDKFDNMPDSLQQGDTGTMLEERASACEELAGELQNIDFDLDIDEDELREQAKDEQAELVEGRKPTKEEIDERFEELKAEKVSERVEELIAEVQEFQYEGE